MVGSKVRVLVPLMLTALVAFACTGAEGPGRSPTSPVSVYPGIWPAKTMDEALAAQRAADAGGRAWMLDPGRVASNYARSVLGFPAPSIGLADPHTVEITDPGSGEIVTVQVTQPVRVGRAGIWVITRADHVVESSLPKPVAVARSAVIAAAMKSDWTALSRLAPYGGFSCSFAAIRDCVSFWKEAEASGKWHPLDVLLKILGMPWTRQGKYVYWPFAFTKDPTTLTPDEKVMLSALYPRIDRSVRDWSRFGGYYGFRTGIGLDGRWVSFVQGD
jgi:hypothetical protein